MNLRRSLLVVAAAALLALGAWFSGPEVPEAEALTVGEIVGVYRVKVRGRTAVQDVQNGTERERYRDAGFREKALLIITKSQSDGTDAPRVDVVLRFDSAPSAGSTLALAAPDPPVKAVGFLVGDSLSVIDQGSREYANVLVLQFAKNGKKVNGSWVSAFHGWDVASPVDERQRKFTSRIHAVILGKRLRVQPQPTSLDSVSTR